MESHRTKLNDLDKKSEEALQQGKYLESLDFMEEALIIRRDLYGEDSDEVKFDYHHTRSIIFLFLLIAM